MCVCVIKIEVCSLCVSAGRSVHLSILLCICAYLCACACIHKYYYYCSRRERKTKHKLARKSAFHSSQKRCERKATGFDLLDLHQLVSNLMAVSPTPGIAPSHHTSILPQGSKGSISGLDLLDISQPVLNQAAITTKLLMATSHHGAIEKNCSESEFG